VYTYNLALEIYVNNMVEVINRRGNALLNLNRPEEALESYNRALELAPRVASYGPYYLTGPMSCNSLPAWMKPWKAMVRHWHTNPT